MNNNRHALKKMNLRQKLNILKKHYPWISVDDPVKGRITVGIGKGRYAVTKKLKRLIVLCCHYLKEN